MTINKIKEEFSRWIEKPEIGVWVKKPDDNKWELFYNPQWGQTYRGYTYVIDNEYAEIRKAYYDGKIIESMNPQINSEWLVATKEPLWNDKLIYRIKPEEPVYEWQWYYIDHCNGNRVILSRNFHTDKYSVEVEENCFKDWIKFEPSKRIKK